MKFAGWLVAAVVLLSGGQQPNDLPPPPPGFAIVDETEQELESKFWKQMYLMLELRQQTAQAGRSKDAPLYVSIVPSRDGVPVDIRHWPPNETLRVNEMRPNGSYRP